MNKDIIKRPDKVIYATSYFRSFGNDLPKHINKVLTDELKERLKSKDVVITAMYEIEILDKEE